MMMCPSPQLIARHFSMLGCVIFAIMIMAMPAFAGVSLGPLPKDATDAEQQRIAQFYEAQKSFQRKLEVGRERYNQRQTNRARVLAAMQAEFVASRQLIVMPPTADSYGKQSDPHKWPVTLLGVAIIGLGFLGFRYYLSRQDAKDAVGQKL